MQDEASYETKLMVWDSDISQAYYILPPFQIIRHSNNLGELKFFMFDQIYIIE